MAGEHLKRHQGGTWDGDVESIDAIVRALYQAVSFPPGGDPDWERLAFLFHPDGRLTPPQRGEVPGVGVLSVSQFAKRSTNFIAQTEFKQLGFHEREVARRSEVFGRLAHVLSTYESRFAETDADPVSRGINSIQLVWDAGRWWVVSIVWDVESPESPIPPNYLGA